MKSIARYIDEAIAKGIVKNDAAVAAALGVTRGAISNWRSGDKAPDEEKAIALARLIKHPEEEMLAAAAAARAKSPAAKAVWERIAKHYAVAASVMVAMATLAAFCVTTAPKAAPMLDVALGSSLLC
ncbi:MAG TPA: helix-turn-helix transcriptional regulator [Rhodocyclaceae bacterium]|nr:helix-turn-helix transcriptional regulator [Rhodocyclaceae bacterium]